jgi:hypothetical protein
MHMVESSSEMQSCLSILVSRNHIGSVSDEKFRYGAGDAADRDMQRRCRILLRIHLNASLNKADGFELVSGKERTR